jgi:hypothetical protein
MALASVLAFSGVAQAAPVASQQEQIHQLMLRYHQLGQLDGIVLVADHGKVVYQRAFGLANREWQVPNTLDSAYRIASLTKQFTATRRWCSRLRRVVRCSSTSGSTSRVDSRSWSSIPKVTTCP